MRTRSRGFLLMELIVAFALFCGVLVMMLLALQQISASTVVDAGRTQAACLLERTLQEVRQGVAPLKASGETVLPLPKQASALPEASCRAEVEDWDADESLKQVTVTVSWTPKKQSERALSATTLIRTSRLRIAEDEQ